LFYLLISKTQRNASRSIHKCRNSFSSFSAKVL
jgi:hypothetical protein